MGRGPGLMQWLCLFLKQKDKTSKDQTKEWVIDRSISTGEKEKVPTDCSQPLNREEK